MKRYLAFTVAELALAIPVDQVFEVAPVPPLMRIPRPARHIEGLATLRGRPVPVMDLRKRLGLVNPVTSRHTRMIVAWPGARRQLLGLIVDSVGEILSVGEAEGPARLPASWVDEGLLIGVLDIQGRPVLLPDLLKIAEGA